jgi:hypothetical protein
VEFAGDGMLYIILRGHWCDIVLNVHAPKEDKIDDMKDSLDKELECVFDKFPKYHMKIVLGDFIVKVSWEDIFLPTVSYESYIELVMIMESKVVNFATSKNLIVNSTMLAHHNSHKVISTSTDAKTHNQIDHILIDRR